MRPLANPSGIDRHRTAIRRTSLSRPIRLAIDQAVINSGTSVLDYGCGHGDDVRNLAQVGIPCSGWDPVHRPEPVATEADVVNLGYVVNVIENQEERSQTLQSAWSLAKVALIVSAQLMNEAISSPIGALGDGVITRLNTFQKYFEHSELRTWIQSTLGKTAIALAPGVFCVFRDASREELYSARRFRSRVYLPAIQRTSGIYEQNKDLFDALAHFVAERGRLPANGELPAAPALAEQCGSLGRAFRILKSLGDIGEWEEVRRKRADDLVVYMALSNFNRLPSWKVLPFEMKLDIRAFFGSYSKARKIARDLLFSLGRAELIDQNCRDSKLGKLTPTALYLHEFILGQLSPALRVYEGCARLIVGSVEGANIIKLHRFSSRVSYLSYPEFDTNPHPPLARSVTVDLKTLDGRFINYENRSNPPILHRKETFVAETYPLFERFKRLTKQEEKHGLYRETESIGTAEGWQQALNLRQLRFQGHRLIRRKITNRNEDQS